MNYEEKLNHLKDWVWCWIDCEVAKAFNEILFWDIYNETGLVISKGSKIRIIPFDEYIQINQNQ